jgi:hypothetical protein
MKMFFKEKWCVKAETGFIRYVQSPVAGSCGLGNETSGFIKAGSASARPLKTKFSRKTCSTKFAFS